MDQRTFVFATRGRCIKGKQCQHVTLKNKTICLCSKQSSLFSFYALPSGGILKDAVVHWEKYQYLAGLMFDWIGFYQTRKYAVISLQQSYRNKTSQTGDKPYSDLPPTVSALCQV